ncbi:MAG TPA: hypothetical protein VHV51_24790 [Polyangiaceae bacterium]|jgi:hypothetical protein|nr:hypothetical protein [Polyangiaceae bacterium]
MLSVLGRRGLEAGISAFALLGFCYVPLGGHTGWEHTKAIFSTPAAKHAAAELIEAFGGLRAKLTGEAVEFASTETSGAPSAEPNPHRTHSEHAHRASEPKPRLPHLSPEVDLRATPQQPFSASSNADAPDASVPYVSADPKI